MTWIVYIFIFRVLFTCLSYEFVYSSTFTINNSVYLGLKHFGFIFHATDLLQFNRTIFFYWRKYFSKIYFLLLSRISTRNHKLMNWWLFEFSVEFHNFNNISIEQWQMPTTKISFVTHEFQTTTNMDFNRLQWRRKIREKKETTQKTWCSFPST